MTDDDNGVGGVGGGPTDDRGTYEVGYGKPPKSGQIKPGEVRNKRGKPRGTRSHKAEIGDMLKMPVPMTLRDRRVNVTTSTAGLMKLREKALKGDQRSLERLLEYAAQHDDAAAVTGSTTALLAEDEQILANARTRAVPPADPLPPQLTCLPTPDDRKDEA